MSSAQRANTTIKVYDSNKTTTLYEITPTKQYQSVIISLEAFVRGQTYIIEIGGSEYQATLSSIATVIGNSNSFGPGGQGGFGPR